MPVNRYPPQISYVGITTSLTCNHNTVTCKSSLTYLEVSCKVRTMNDPTDALEVLSEAEASLRGMIEQALAEHRYGDVAAIAKIVDELVELIDSTEKTLGGEPSPTEPVVASRPRPPTVAHSRKRAKKSIATSPKPTLPTRQSVRSRREYPYFEQDSDKLIKVGWSKKDRRVYEHRAPRNAVFLFSKQVASKTAGNKVFTMDDILPLTDERGGEFPSYQAYLALAWLRSVGAIDRRGKDGYIVSDGTLNPKRIEHLWNLVPPRK